MYTYTQFANRKMHLYLCDHMWIDYSFGYKVIYELAKYLLLGIRISIAFIKFCFIAPLLVNQDDGAENDNFRTDS